MKPNEARARRRAAEAQQQAAGDMLRAYLEDETNPLDKVVPDLIPTEEDRERLAREILRLGRRAEKQPRGAARNRKIDEMLPLVGRLVLVDEVLALDRLERAGVTPRRLRAIAARVTPEAMQAKVAELNGVAPAGPRVELPR